MIQENTRDSHSTLSHPTTVLANRCGDRLASDSRCQLEGKLKPRMSWFTSHNLPLSVGNVPHGMNLAQGQQTAEHTCATVPQPQIQMTTALNDGQPNVAGHPWLQRSPRSRLKTSAHIILQLTRLLRSLRIDSRPYTKGRLPRQCRHMNGLLHVVRPTPFIPCSKSKALIPRA
ncbi:hypothetical protein GY45DRAFT_114644 [Cubamyces sp. BRFM 1775]|nr:hypothetical protein GY45DRAFT_114644 [Cubamyces sp. BRFM 1775]